MTNPLAGNRFAGPADTADAVRALMRPLLPHVSAGSARVRLGPGGAHFHEAAADLEGFARPLWGLAPLAAGGHVFDHWAPFQAGLASGADSDHPEYWGAPIDHDQRIVESAALGFALALAPEVFWEPLTGRGRDRLGGWLKSALEAEPHGNNWMFFRVLVSHGLDRVGIAYDRSLVEHSLSCMEACDIGEGWYRDGQQRRAEHYIPFAMHYYGLIHAALARGDEARCERFRDRARRFAPQLAHWYADDGAALPYGRSLTYRFAHAGFWAALAFADVEGLPWGAIRGFWGRNLRWWSEQPMADRDGVLPIGYAYPNLLMSEPYNSQGSPYWAMKAFLPLALDRDHPFWQAEETSAPVPDRPVTIAPAGMVIVAQPGNVTALTGGQEGQSMRHGPEKYAKFAYSTRYAFSVESHPCSFETGAFDSMLAFSDDGRHFRVRETEIDARIDDGLLYSRWSPLADVDVETWLIPVAQWHVRVHRITSAKALQIVEGGFAVRRTDRAPVRAEAEEDRALVETEDDVSVVLALPGSAVRTGRVQKADPNTNLQNPRTWVPQLRGRIESGQTLLMTAVLASANRSEAIQALMASPSAPSISELERRRDGAGRIPVWTLTNGVP